VYLDNSTKCRTSLGICDARLEFLRSVSVWSTQLSANSLWVRVPVSRNSFIQVYVMVINLKKRINNGVSVNVFRPYMILSACQSCHFLPYRI